MRCSRWVASTGATCEARHAVPAQPDGCRHRHLLATAGMSWVRSQVRLKRQVAHNVRHLFFHSVHNAMFKHILLATDGSSSAEHAAQKAFQLARVHGGQVTAAFVVDPYPYVGLGSMNPLGLEAYRAAAHATAGKAFSHLTELAQAAGVQLEARIVEESHVVQGILAAAEDVAADLIIVGSHGRSGLQRMLAGSVATHVVGLSTRPVLVVR